MRIGLLGGTFNPVHRGHLLMAEGARRHLQLDEVVWIPAHLPPHKPVEGKATPEDRARMVQLAIEHEPAFQLSRVELDRPPPSYTIDTVEQLQQEQPGPDNAWFFLIGSETARELGTWREIDRLKTLVQFIAIPRPGVSWAGPLPEGVREIPVRTADVSSSEIRRRIRAGLAIGDDLPEPVRRYLEEKGLYR